MCLLYQRFQSHVSNSFPSVFASVFEHKLFTIVSTNKHMLLSSLLKSLPSCNSQKWCVSRKSSVSSLKLVPRAKSFCLPFLALATSGKGSKRGYCPFSLPASLRAHPSGRGNACCCFMVVGRWHHACACVESDRLPVRLLTWAFPSNQVLVCCQSPGCWNTRQGHKGCGSGPSSSAPGGPWVLPSEQLSKWMDCWSVPQKMPSGPNEQFSPTSRSSRSSLPFLLSAADRRQSSCYLEGE